MGLICHQTMSPSPLHTMMPMAPKGTDASASITRGPMLIAVSATMTFLALTSCILRWFVRRRTNRKLRWDEYTIIGSVVMTIGSLIFIMLSATSISKSPINALHSHYTATPLITLSTAFSQASSAFYLHRTLGHRRIWKTLLATFIVLLGAVNLIFILTSNLLCTPLDILWDPAVMGSCVEDSTATNIGYLHSAFVAVVFVYLGIFVISGIWLVETARRVQCPYYLVAGFNFACVALTIVWTFETSTVGARPALSDNLLIVTILGVTIENLSLTTANILPILPLFTSCSSSSSTKNPPNPELEDSEDETNNDTEYAYDSDAASVDLEKNPQTIFTTTPLPPPTAATALSSNSPMTTVTRNYAPPTPPTLMVPQSAAPPLSPIVETPRDEGEGIVKRVSVSVTEEVRSEKDKEVARLGDYEWVDLIKGKKGSPVFIGAAQ